MTQAGLATKILRRFRVKRSAVHVVACLKRFLPFLSLDRASLACMLMFSVRLHSADVRCLWDACHAWDGQRKRYSLPRSRSRLGSKVVSSLLLHIVGVSCLVNRLLGPPFFPVFSC